ncbi:(deoxy)nucleoside triphosphate pyrophosphohydrolase [Streptomyces sp. NPDC049577]|uniref:(deoxy)nucleoside triphosphate pyrophosphohydrolase n=1 Tax=Streptomyces sp. NPDC049577 TaxID=3155153 RepID=UPI003420E8B0
MTTVRVVVAGAVLDRGRLLAARRSAPPELAGRWELPGGKIEPGETGPQALVRELREELGIEAEPLERIAGEWPLKPGYVLRVWTARLLSGEPLPLEDHDEVRWLTPERVDEVDWLDQDRPAVAEAMRLLTEHVSHPS